MKYIGNTVQAAFAFGLGRNSGVWTGLGTSLSALPAEKKESIILDGVGLATTSGVDKYNTKIFDEFRGKGLDITPVQKEGQTDYKIKTANNSYDLETLEQIDKHGFHAKSYLVHQKPLNSKNAEGVESLRIAFGGTRDKDWGRTFAMHVTKLPLHYEKNIRELIDKTIDTYQERYPEKKLPDIIISSGHSAGVTHANKALEILDEKKLDSCLYVHSYDGFGAKFSKLSKENQNKVVSFSSDGTFLKYFPIDGDPIGHKVKLPRTQKQKDIDNGKAINMANGGIIGNSIASSIKGHMLDSIMDAALEMDKENVEIEYEPIKKSHSDNILKNYSSDMYKSRKCYPGFPQNCSTGMLSRT